MLVNSPVAFLYTVLVFLPKSLFSMTLILICITLPLVTLLGNLFSFHFIAWRYKRNVMSVITVNIGRRKVKHLRCLTVACLEPCCLLSLCDEYRIKSHNGIWPKEANTIVLFSLSVELICTWLKISLWSESNTLFSPKVAWSKWIRRSCLFSSNRTISTDHLAWQTIKRQWQWSQRWWNSKQKIP